MRKQRLGKPLPVSSIISGAQVAFEVGIRKTERDMPETYLLDKFTNSHRSAKDARVPAQQVFLDHGDCAQLAYSLLVFTIGTPHLPSIPAIRSVCPPGEMCAI